MKSGVKLGLFALGLALFGWFVYRAGPAEILKVFAQIGWWLPLALLPYFVVYGIDTLAWRFAFGAGRRPPFLTLFRIRWAGEAINNLIPTAYVGGEAIKTWLLHRRGIPLATATTSVVVSKTLQVAAQVVFIAMGAVLAVVQLRAGSPARPAFAIVAVLSVVALLVLIWIQSRGLFSCARMLATRLRLRFLESRQAQLRELDDRIFGFYHQQPRAALASGLTYLGGWMGDAFEVFIVSRLLGFPMDYPTALAIESFISVAKALGIFVPGSLGVQESGVWFLFGVFGFSQPQAAAYAIVRRGRDLIYAAIGTGLLYAEGGSLRGMAAAAAAAHQNGAAGAASIPSAPPASTAAPGPKS
jgi:putative membrane protein